MKKTTYLTILMILWFGVWGFIPIRSMLGSADMLLIVKLAYMLLGYRYYKKDVSIKWAKGLLSPFGLIVAGILLSFIPAMFYYNQGFIQSFITYREQFLWLIIPMLFCIKPSEEEIVKVALNTTYLMIGVYILRYIYPSLFYMDEEKFGVREFQESYINGFAIPTIPIFYYLMKMRGSYDKKDLLIIGICYAYIFLMHNRSTLFPVTLFIGYSMLQLKSRYKFAIVGLMVVVVFFIASSTMDTWMELIEKTTTEFNDEDYNRNVAFTYFMFEANHNWFTTTLGNGFLSSNSTSLMANLQLLGIYNSDLGFIGFWNQYGLIPIYAFLLVLLTPLLKWRKYNWNVKLWALQILACGLTTSYFGSSIHMIYFALYFYIFSLNKNSLRYSAP